MNGCCRFRLHPRVRSILLDCGWQACSKAQVVAQLRLESAVEAAAAAAAATVSANTLHTADDGGNRTRDENACRPVASVQVRFVNVPWRAALQVAARHVQADFALFWRVQEPPRPASYASAVRGAVSAEPTNIAQGPGAVPLTKYAETHGQYPHGRDLPSHGQDKSPHGRASGRYVQHALRAAVHTYRAGVWDALQARRGEFPSTRTHGLRCLCTVLCAAPWPLGPQGAASVQPHNESAASVQRHNESAAAVQWHDQSTAMSEEVERRVGAQLHTAWRCGARHLLLPASFGEPACVPAQVARFYRKLLHGRFAGLFDYIVFYRDAQCTTETLARLRRAFDVDAAQAQGQAQAQARVQEQVQGQAQVHAQVQVQEQVQVQAPVLAGVGDADTDADTDADADAHMRFI